MKKILIIAGVIIAAIIAGIIVINNYDMNTPANTSTKVGLLLNNTHDDKSWCQSHYDAILSSAEELDLEITYRENITADNLSANIDTLINDGCEIIIASSFDFSDGIVAAAEKYPEVYFLHATGTGSAKNLSTYFGRMYQARYLCGIVAGMQTENNRIGYVAAFPISEVNRGINAFALGVRHVNPEAEVYVSWTYSWDDDDAAAIASDTLIDDYGIDLLTLHTDSISPLEIAEQRGIMSIGYHLDNSSSFPNSYLTAATWDWENFYTTHIRRCMQGKFEGQHYWQGIETEMVSLAPFSDKVDSDTAEAVQQQKELMLNGTFDVFYGPVTDNNGVLRVGAEESMTDNAMLNEFNWYVEGVTLTDDK